jgi:hypothetical protein
MTASENNIHRLVPETANENTPTPGLLFASLTESISISDWAGWRFPHIGQATDSTMRGYLQALNDDPFA